jgi:hypothetical protein
MHSCGSAAIKDCSWPSFWGNLASVSLGRRALEDGQAHAADLELHPPRPPRCELRDVEDLRAGAYDVFGVFWTSLPQKIGVFHSSSQNEVRLSPNAL